MSTRPILTLFLLIPLMLTCLPATVEAWEGVVLRVVDGDTLIVAPVGVSPDLLGVSVRLYGIDAPEMNRPGGKEAKAALEKLAVPGDAVQVLTMESDRYDRLVGVVARNGTLLNVLQIRSGHARVDEKYCRARFCGEWKREEKEKSLQAVPVSP